MGWERAIERRQRIVPFPLIGGLARPEVDALRPKLGGAARLGCAIVDIAVPGDLKRHESGGHDRGLELRIQQSTGNSAGPQIYLAFGIGRHRFQHRNIADL